jgi:hypothetical protein
VRSFESVNFLDFARLLAAFSDRASYDEKVRFIFRVYDVDGDGEHACVWQVAAAAAALQQQQQRPCGAEALWRWLRGCTRAAWHCACL